MGFFSVLCLLCLCARLIICALWSPAGKELTSRLSFVVYNCEFVTFPLVSWVRCGTWLYRFLIFAPLLTLLSFGCLITVNVLWFCLTVPWVGLQFVIMVFFRSYSLRFVSFLVLQLSPCGRESWFYFGCFLVCMLVICFSSSRCGE